MTEAIELAQKLSSVGFPTLLVIMLFGSYFGVWVWGRFHRETVAQYEARLAKAEASAERWQDMALRGAGLAENLGTIARNRGAK